MFSIVYFIAYITNNAVALIRHRDLILSMNQIANLISNLLCVSISFAMAFCDL